MELFKYTDLRMISRMVTNFEMVKLACMSTMHVYQKYKLLVKQVKGSFEKLCSYDYGPAEKNEKLVVPSKIWTCILLVIKLQQTCHFCPVGLLKLCLLQVVICNLIRINYNKKLVVNKLHVAITCCNLFVLGCKQV